MLTRKSTVGSNQLCIKVDIPDAIKKMGFDYRQVKLDGPLYGFRKPTQPMNVRRDQAYNPENIAFQVDEMVVAGKYDVKLLISPIDSLISKTLFNKMKEHHDKGGDIVCHGAPIIGEGDNVLSFNRVIFTLE